MLATVKINLAHPIAFGRRALRAVELRAPTATDFSELPPIVEAGAAKGNPRRVVVRRSPHAVAAWIERLSGVEFDDIARLDLTDVARLVTAIERMNRVFRPVN